MDGKFWMVDASGEVVFDLFGDPIPASRGQKGRPVHVVTAENRHRVTILFACGHTEQDAAAVLGISMPTLRKHYFSELGAKRTARLKLEIKNTAAIIAQVDAGNAAAMSLLDKKLERWKRDDLSDQLANRGRADHPDFTPKLGKKDQAKADATATQGRFAPPSLIH